ncbi:unannotated protein [freshwater metagenome]|uniref:Unannotated protein n=1 Tax=freshwater metagenome TaxID=449393 RepID=A0A6J7XV66_9ZZZZ
MPTMKPINHAIIESNVILSSRLKNNELSESAGRKASASRQTTNALIAPSASAVKRLSLSMRAFLCVVGRFASVVMLMLLQRLRDLLSMSHILLGLQREPCFACMRAGDRIIQHIGYQTLRFYLG